MCIRDRTKDNQSNFGTGFEYQYGAANTIEIFMNEKWIVFEPVSYTHLDVYKRQFLSKEKEPEIKYDMVIGW